MGTLRTGRPSYMLAPPYLCLQVFNALKYLSAFPALLLTLQEHESHVHGRPFGRFYLWICFAAFNSLFSYYWDVEQDWDMPWLAAAASGCHRPGESGYPW